MKKSIFSAALCLAVAGAFGLTAFGVSSQHTAMAASAVASSSKLDIIDTAVGPGMTEVTTLVAAIKAAGLVEALKGEGPFTVFAPTNAAFAKLPEGTVATLLKPENKAKLTGILLYHVHKGAGVLAKDVKTMKLSTLNGKDLDIVAEYGKVTVNGANVIKTDIVASNGVIHWVDTVILPAE